MKSSFILFKYTCDVNDFFSTIKTDRHYISSVLHHNPKCWCPLFCWEVVLFVIVNLILIWRPSFALYTNRQCISL
jgi:hypothetical protein